MSQLIIIILLTLIGTASYLTVKGTATALERPTYSPSHLGHLDLPVPNVNTIALDTVGSERPTYPPPPPEP